MEDETLKLVPTIIIAWSVILIPLWIILVKRHRLRAKALENPVLERYVKLQVRTQMLEEYMWKTRKSVLAYELMKYDPKLAIIAIETMRQELQKMSVDINPSEEEAKLLGYLEDEIRRT